MRQRVLVFNNEGFEFKSFKIEKNRNHDSYFVRRDHEVLYNNRDGKTTIHIQTSGSRYTKQDLNELLANPPYWFRPE